MTIEVPVRLTRIVDPAVGDAVDRLHLVHDSQPAAFDDIQDGPKERRHAHREGDDHRFLTAPVGVAEGNDLVVGDGNRFFEVQRKPGRRGLHCHRRMDIAPRPYHQGVEVAGVPEHLVGVGKERRLPFRQLGGTKSPTGSLPVRIGHRYHLKTAVDAAKNPE